MPRWGDIFVQLDSLEVFCAVVETGSITKAAQALHMTQSTASRHLHALEDYYGTILTNRTATGAIVTDAGRVLYRYAREMLDCHRRAQEDIVHLGEDVGSITVGATFSIGEYVLPRLLGYFRELHPTVQLKMKIGNSATMIEDLRLRHIDLALVEGPVEDGQMTAEDWRADELILVANPNHRFAEQLQMRAGDLIGEAVIVREEGSGTREVAAKALRKSGIHQEIDFVMELGSTQAVKAAVAAGLGVAFLSRMTVQDECRSGTLVEVPIEDLKIPRMLKIVRRKERYSTRLAEEMLRFLRLHGTV